MPSPFPGMDPYLEHPLLWPSLQQYFIGTLADMLGEVLPRRYQTRIRERIYHEGSLNGEPGNGDIPPPACAPPNSDQQQAPPDPMPGEVHPVWYIPTTPEEVRETGLEIILASEPDRVRTAIEFLTVANKTPQSQGRRQYLEQRRQLLSANAHLLEIDFLRAGRHTVLAPRQRLLRRGRYHYLACQSRAGRRDFCEVWGIPLRERLPRIAVPLTEEPDLILDLQSLFSRCYDEGGFARQADYDHDPFFPLSSGDARWAEAILEQVGLRL